MKKISILLTFGLLFYTSSTLLAYNFHDLSTQALREDDNDDDYFSIDTDLNDISLDNNTHNLIIRRSTTDNADRIAAFFALIDDPNALLNIPIYQKTNQIRSRPILEYPFALTYGFDSSDKNLISLLFFLNKSSEKKFTKDSTTLNSYFDLANADRIATLQRAADLIGFQMVAGLAQSLTSFDPSKLQENRIGGLLEAHVIHNKISLSIQMPILYAERNLYLSPAEKSMVALSPLGSMMKSDGVDEDDFTYKHLVMDQFGFGDLKFKTMYELYQNKNLDLYFGGFIILPTAKALKQGIIGTWFDQNNKRAYLDLATIDPSNITTQNYQDIATFFLEAIDKLSSNILNCPLGNNGHVVVAPSLNSDWFFAQDWQMSSDISLQIPFPTKEQRFYQKTQTESQFLTEYNAAFASDSVTFVRFINEELQDLFFPYVFSTSVFPGITFNSTNQFIYTYNAWDVSLGSNFWYQSAESLTLSDNALNPSAQQSYTYDYAGATTPSLAQEKLFGKINCNLNSTNHSWSLSLYGDITVWNSGMGNDFTLGLCVDCKF